MKKVKITEANYKQVFGRLKKFFNHDNLLTWHQFDCGMKKRIGHFIHFNATVDNGIVLIPEHKSNVMFPVRNVEYHVECADFILYYSDDIYSDEPTSAMTITIGDEVVFIGNRIIVKSPTKISHYKYLYQCFQIGGEG